MKERFQKENTVINLFSIPVVLYTVYLLVSILLTTFAGTEYPNEYREAANIQMTEAIMEGVNPYSLETLESEIPAPFYLYGPLFSIVTALVAMVIRIDLVALHYLLSFVVMVASAVLVAKMVYEHSRTITAPTAAFLFTIMCHWRYGYIYAAPDSFGLFLLIVILYVLTRKRFRLQPFVCAVLTIAVLLTKQYYVMIAGTAVVYFLFLSKKDALCYVLDGIILSLLGGALIAWKFPLFLTYALYFVKGPGSGVASGSAGASHNTSQVSYLGGMFICLFVIAAFDFVRTAIVKRGIRLRFQWREIDQPLVLVEVRDEEIVYGKRKIVFDILFWGQMALAFICLQYLGKNDGAWISYYLQLFMPGLIVAALTAIDNYSYEKIWRWMHFVCYALMLLITVMKTDKRLVVNHMSEEALADWQQAYEILDTSQNEENFYIPAVAYKGFARGEYVYNSGQPFVLTQQYLEEYENDTLMQKLFPHAGEIMKQHLDYRDEIRRKVRDGEYAVVTDLANSDVIFTEEDLLLHYEKSVTIPLKTGNWTYEIDFWERIN